MRSLAHLNPYFLKYKWHLIGGIIFIAISVVFSIYPAQLIRKSFNVVEEAIVQYQAGEQENISSVKDILVYYGLLIIGASLLRGLFMFFMRQTIIVMSRHIEYDLKNEIYAHYQRLSMAFYKRNNTGDLMNRISEDVSRVRMYIGPAIMYSINVIITLIIVIPVMLDVDVRLTLITLAPFPFLAYAIYRISTLINKRSERVQHQLSNISTFAQESFAGIRVIKTYKNESYQESRFEEETHRYHEVYKKLYSVEALFFPFMLLLIGLSTILTIYIGGMGKINGTIEIGNIPEFLFYVALLTWPVTAIGWVTSIIQRAAASQTRINEFLHTEPEIVNPSQESMTVKGEIVFDKVTFDYPDSGIRALNAVSFSVKPGETLAIIGKTGSGKSTIAALVGRMYDPTAGTIKIDGKDIRTLNLDDLRFALGYVPQDAFLFSDSISQNIAFGMDEPKQQEIEKAAVMADVHNNIIDFPKQYETRVGERGITLSGGQKQRVSIARAIAKKPAIFIFDDSLSAVDTETEENILQNLKSLIRKNTTIIISHRVSSVKNADKILVLEEGEIIEEGTHNQLIEKGTYYKKLYDKQLTEKPAIIGGNDLND